MKQSLRRFVVLLLLLAANVAFADDENLIVPGERIGPAQLLMSIDDLVRAIGPKQGLNPHGPTEFPPNPKNLAMYPLWNHAFDKMYLRALTVERSAPYVAALVAFSPRYKTAADIGTGATREQVIAAYGPPTIEIVPEENLRYLIYDRIGMTVRIRKYVAFDKPIVVGVYVFHVGTARMLWRY